MKAAAIIDRCFAFSRWLKMRRGDLVALVVFARKTQRFCDPDRSIFDCNSGRLAY
jgi:hypothetical protein